MGCVQWQQEMHVSPYQKDERAKPRHLLTNWCSFCPHTKVSLTIPSYFNFFYSSTSKFLSLCLHPQNVTEWEPSPSLTCPSNTGDLSFRVPGMWSYTHKGTEAASEVTLAVFWVLDGRHTYRSSHPRPISNAQMRKQENRYWFMKKLSKLRTYDSKYIYWPD